ncbi:MAG: PIN domain-containing protein, partial [Acidimicrobiales bacterium]
GHNRADEQSVPSPAYPCPRGGSDARLLTDMGQKIHEADRWVATTALVLGLELVAGDAIYEGVDGLDVHRIRPS